MADDHTLDIKAIMAAIPHRYPFLLVDKIVEYSDTHTVGLKNVTINEPHFMGHWPEEPVMPGVLQLEALAQAGAVLLFQKLLANSDEQLDVFFRGIDKAVFRKIVRPGDQLMLHVNLLKERRGIYVMSGVCKVDGEVASQAQMTAVVMPRGAAGAKS
jgi:3-hydroxyacyl-[acyl-carrier-protein] dehydratase